MSLRNLTKLKLSRVAFRSLSTAPKFVEVSINDDSGISVLSLKRPPVNSLNTDLYTQINDALLEAENNKVRGLILTSKKDGVFSAGNDLMEYYQPEPDRLRHFCSMVIDTWLNLFRSSYPTVALINGHAPGTACFLATACEYRVMTKNLTIGLNEALLGFPVAQSHIMAMNDVIGTRETEIAVTSGKMFTTDEALAVGLIDEAVDNTDEGLLRAYNFLGRFEKISPQARALTKSFVRGPTLDKCIKNRQHELDSFVELIQKPETQSLLGQYIQMLKTKSSNKNK